MVLFGVNPYQPTLDFAFFILEKQLYLSAFDMFDVTSRQELLVFKKTNIA